MKKILLVISILTYCLTAKSQSFSSSYTAASGTTITVVATDETQSCYFTSLPSLDPTATTTSSPGTDLSNWVNGTVGSLVNQYNPISQQATSFKFTVKNTFNQNITATFYVYVTQYCNGTYSQVKLPVTVTITPATVPIITYYNDDESLSYTKNSCGTGYVGSKVTYPVPAGKFSSTISKADANQKGITDRNANGQSYANTHGICTPAIYVRTESIRTGSTVYDHVSVSPATGMPWVDGSTTITTGDVKVVVYKDAACTQPLILSSPLTVYVGSGSTHEDGPGTVYTVTVQAGTNSAQVVGGVTLDILVAIQDSYDDNVFYFGVGGNNNTYIPVASI